MAKSQEATRRGPSESPQDEDSRALALAHQLRPDDPLTRRGDDGSYRRVWRELLFRRLRRGQVRLSRARSNEDPLSEPGSDEERYGLRVMELEDYRSRPAAAGYQPHWVAVHDDIEHVLRPWEEDVRPSTWHRQPRGVVSEWFPLT